MCGLEICSSPDNSNYEKYSPHYPFKQRLENGDWDLAHELEELHYVVQEVYHTGVVRCKLPDWYLLKSNWYNLTFKIVDDLSTIRLSLVKIGQHSFFVKRG